VISQSYITSPMVRRFKSIGVIDSNDAELVQLVHIPKIDFKRNSFRFGRAACIQVIPVGGKILFWITKKSLALDHPVLVCILGGFSSRKKKSLVGALQIFKKFLST